MTNSPTRLMIWSTFSTPTRMVLLDADAAPFDSVFAAAAAFAGAGAGSGAAAMGAGAAGTSAAGAWTGWAGWTGCELAGADAVAGTGSRVISTWSSLTIKQQTACRSSAVAVVSSQMLRLSAPGS